MSNSKSSNRLVVPSARDAMDKFKMEAATDVGVHKRKNHVFGLKIRPTKPLFQRYMLS